MTIPQDWIFFIIPFGLIIGSFLNVCIYRLPRKLSLIWPRSYCPKCIHALSWWQNIPLISFLWLRGRCFYCDAHISWSYPLVELLTLIITLILFFQFQYLGAFVFYLLFFSGMIVIGGIDMSHRIVSNEIVLLLLLSGIVLNYLFKVNCWLESISGFVLALLFTLLLRWSTTSFFKKESLGLGDIKLSALTGFYLGFESFLFSLFLGSIIGIIYQVINERYHKKLKERYLPLAPFLGIGALFGIIYLPLIELFL